MKLGNQADGSLGDLKKRELTQLWQRRLNRPAPNVSATLLCLDLQWELQAKDRGGLSAKTQRRLRLLATGTSSTDRLSPGTRLVRERNGKVEVVTLGEDGEIIWNDKEWRSLSEVARAITGTRWSGPAFFGLKKKARGQ
ncbi:MAG: DUF2924 domain-containing protein [Pseudomonadota bacterium]